VLLIDARVWQFEGVRSLKQVLKTLAVLRRFDERTLQHLAKPLTIQGRLQGKDALEPVKFSDTDRNASVLEFLQEGREMLKIFHADARDRLCL
jgi:hypothetical protein